MQVFVHKDIFLTGGLERFAKLTCFATKNKVLNEFQLKCVNIITPFVPLTYFYSFYRSRYTYFFFLVLEHVSFSSGMLKCILNL